MIFKVIWTAHARYGIDKLCIAGGVGLNVANGKIVENTPVNAVFVQPASGDDGGRWAVPYLHTQMFKDSTAGR